MPPPHRHIDRRTLLLAAVAAGVGASHAARATGLPTVTVHKDPSCGCCEAWVDHIKAGGYAASVLEAPRINAVKTRLGVPQPLWSCHTAEVEGYVLEGHVPASAIERLLAERPKVRGLAVPGMPVGSPGMEVEGREPQAYDVIAFGDGAPQTFMSFKGSSPA